MNSIILFMIPCCYLLGAGLYVYPAESTVIDSNFLLIYNHGYDHVTTPAELASIYSSYPTSYYIAVIGKSYNDIIVACVDKIQKALPETTSTTVANAGSVAGIYWYNNYANSFGCSPESVISIGFIDWAKQTEDYRLSWRMQGNNGRRIGMNISEEPTEKKLIYINLCPLGLMRPCTSCVDGYYISSGNCLQCHGSCDTCDNGTASGCLSCNTGYTRNAGFLSYCSKTSSCPSDCDLCVGPAASDCIRCDTTYFVSTIPGTCQSCHTSCQTCTNNTALGCITCRTSSGYNFDTDYPGYCVKTSCGTSCNACISGNSNDCLNCKNRYYRTAASYPSSCGNCDSSCATCDDGTSCLTCFSHSFLNTTNLCQVCFTTCLECHNISYFGCDSCAASNYWYNANICAHDTSCPSNCIKCIGGSSNNCVECGTKYFLAGSYPNSCAACHESCQDCTSASATTCTSCRTSNSYYSDTSYPNYCVKTTCSGHCDICFSGTTGDCLLCETKYYLTAYSAPSSCTACMSACATCDNGTTCLTCISHYFLNSSDKCEICHNSCLECHDNTFFGCDSCNSTFNWFGSAVCSHNSPCYSGCSECVGSLINDCVDCDQKKYLISSYPSSCGNCYASCLECNSNSPTDCISCNLPDTYDVDVLYPGYCVKSSCWVGCDVCFSDNTNDCLKCSDKYYPTLYSYPSSCTQCISTCATCDNGTTCLTCISHYFLNTSDLCEVCHDSCLECRNNSAFGCDSCDPLYYWYSSTLCIHNINCGFECSRCYENTNSACVDCHPNYYLKEAFPSECNACHISCLECNANSYITCITCNPGYSFNPLFPYVCTTNTGCTTGCEYCVGPNITECFQCKNKYYNFPYAQPYQCFNCMALCETCSNDYTCSSCVEHYFLTNEKLCEECHPSCGNCTGKSPFQWLTCQTGYTLIDGLCTHEVNCITNCEKCIGSLIMDCVKCDTHYFLSGVAPNNCQQCHKSCLNCTSASAATCHDCQVSDGFSNNTDYIPYCSTTNNCATGCAICFDASPQSCLKSLVGYYPLSLPYPFISLKCYSLCTSCLDGSTCINCISHYYLNTTTKVCVECHPSCGECDNSSYNACKTCNIGYTLNGSFCVRSDICVTGCDLCVSNMPYECNICKERYFIVEDVPTTCIPCHSSCLTCNGINPSSCIVCENAYERPTYNNEYCITHDCQLNCKDCIANISFGCTLCNDGYYKEVFIGKCNQCPPECTKCMFLDGAISCNECISHYYLNNSLSFGRCLCKNLIRLQHTVLRMRGATQ